MRKIHSSSKPFIITAILAMMMFFASAALFTASAEVIVRGTTITEVQKQDQITDFTYIDKDGKVYPVWISKNKKFYVKKISKKTGKEYKHYLPKDAYIKLPLVKNSIDGITGNTTSNQWLEP
jgi:hypothetical protein